MTEKKKPYVPVRCVFETTLACNLRCRHCGSRAGTARPDELTTNEIEGLFEQLRDLGCRKVTLSGGEPMMRDDWLELIRAARRNDLQVAMITNGTEFDEEAASKAKKAGLATIGLSIDGIGQTHDKIRGRIGHYRSMMSAIDAANKVNLSYTIITTLNRHNLGELDELYDLANESNAFSWQVQSTFEMGNAADHPELRLRNGGMIAAEKKVAGFIRRNKQRVSVCNSFGYFGPNEKVLRKSYNAPHFIGCAAGIRTMGIESNGNVKGCLSMMAGCSELRPDLIEGNVRNESLAEIWNRPGAFAYNRDWSIDDMGGFCRECRHVEKCRGGCRTNMIISGDGVENTVCVYRALNELSRSSCKNGRAAAMILAALLGTSAAAAACSDDGSTSDGYSDVDMDVDGYDTDTDTDNDTDTDIDTDTDNDVDTDTDSDVDGYDTDMDTDTDTDTEVDAGTDAGDDSGVDVDHDVDR